MELFCLSNLMSINQKSSRVRGSQTNVVQKKHEIERKLGQADVYFKLDTASST